MSELNKYMTVRFVYVLFTGSSISLDVLVGNTFSGSFIKSSFQACASATLTPGALGSFMCPVKLTGSFVAVSASATTSLTLCEVRVYGTKGKL